MRYMLDANAISMLVREPQGSVAKKLVEVGEANIFTSVIVSAEIAFGVQKRGSAELTRKVANVMSKLYVAALDPPTASNYADIRLTLERQGQPIGPNDLWIAAHAVARNATLVTGNISEFSRVPGLKVENWLQSQP